MNRLFIQVTFVLDILIFATLAYATCGSDCVQYCGIDGSHGYCTNYIRYRLDARQSGDAGSWIENVNSTNIQAGDVAIFDFGSYGHVAVIESVNGNNITISEWNWGSMVNVACAVTDTYEETTERTIAKNTVTRFWRPSNSAASPPIPYRRVLDQNISIYLSCTNASAWCYGTCSANFTNSVCSTAHNALLNINWSKYASQDWQYTFFGNQAEFDSVGNCSSN